MTCQVASRVLSWKVELELSVCLEQDCIHRVHVVLRDKLQCRYLSHIIAEWYLHHSDFTNTPTYAHTVLRTLHACDVSLGSLTLSAPESGDFMKLLLLQSSSTVWKGGVNPPSILISTLAQSA